MIRRDAAVWGTLALTLALTGWTALLPDDLEPVGAPAALATDERLPGPEHSASAPPPRGPWLAPTDVALAAWSAPPSVPPDVAPAVEAQPVSEAPLAPTTTTVPLVPPLPWRWLGRLDDAAGPQALIDGPGGARLVRESEVLDGQWRIDRIAHDHLRWTWLPAGLPRILNRS